MISDADLNTALRCDPFAGSGAWWESISWRLARLSARATAQQADLAERALRELFPPEWVRERLQGFKSFRFHPHPFFHGFESAPPDPRLLEVGHALVTLEVDEEQRGRLLGDHFEEAYLELVAGFVVRAAGASVRAAPRTGVKRPEWIARWPDGFELAVEAKRPARQAQAWREQDVAIGLHREACERIPPGPRVRFSPNQEVVRALAAKDDESEARAYATAFVASTLELMARGRWGHHVLEGLGAVTVEDGAGPFDVEVQGYHLDPERNANKPVGLLFKAARQINVSGHDGIVILDGTHHRMMDGWDEGILRALTSPDSRRIALVLVHHHVGLPYEHRFWGVRGPAWERLGHRLDGAWSRGVAGHLVLDAWKAPAID